MRKLLAATTIAAALVAAPAAAHTWGGAMWFGPGNNPDHYSSSTEAMFYTEVALKWNEDKNKLRANAHDRINASALWVSERSTDLALHSCLVDWDAGGPTPGWTVYCYAGSKP